MKALTFKQWLALLAFTSLSVVVMAQTSEPASPAIAMPMTAPVSQGVYTFEKLGRTDSLNLLSIHDTEQVEFTLRRDQIATNATLNLVFTPSPALTPKLSHLRIFLNDELMGVIPITTDMLGQSIRQRVALDARYITDFNRLRIEFVVGHYINLCEDLTRSSLWVDISRESSLNIDLQDLSLRNDLALFPHPFFDEGDPQPLTLPMVFSDQPGPVQLRAAAILASYFGTQAKWRGATFPVSFDALPNRHGIVFATNNHRPAFLRDYPQVQAPVVAMISHPDNSYIKLLLILGRNDADLVQAAAALALGNTLFRGNSVTINKVEKLRPRVPHDAPNWTRTDRPVQFKELLEYPSQLEAVGLRPRPITLNVNLSPDLFTWRNQGIPMQLKYRYSPPPAGNDSRLHVSINSQFVHGFALPAPSTTSLRERMRLPLLADGLFGAGERVLIPALEVGDHNTLRFDFSFASRITSNQAGVCQLTLPVGVRAAIDEDSTLDFSGYYHFISLPNLRVFANSGFPFSRMADLSETVAVMPKNAMPAHIATLLDTVGSIGAATGYPGFGLKVTDDWQSASAANADLLVIGPMPADLRSRPDTNALLENTRSWLRQPKQDVAVSPLGGSPLQNDNRTAPGTKVEVSAQAPIGAFVGMQSPFHAQRSVVGLLGSTPEDFKLLRTALSTPSQRAAISGSVAVVRESGVASVQVGPVYYVGYLPWWTLLWYHLSDRPVLLAIFAALTVVLLTFVIWYGLRQVARSRLARDQDN
jgi:hypothetical protein